MKTELLIGILMAGIGCSDPSGGVVPEESRAADPIVVQTSAGNETNRDIGRKPGGEGEEDKTKDEPAQDERGENDPETGDDENPERFEPNSEATGRE